VQRIGGAAKIESFQSSHDGNQKKKPKDQQPDYIGGRLFDSAALKRLLDAGTIRKCIELTNPTTMRATENKRFGKNTAILVTNASQKPVTVTTGFIVSSFAAGPLVEPTK
jgi:hypothetical protein